MSYLEKRSVSGIFFRCKRENGKGFENRTFEDLPEHEQDRVLGAATEEFNRNLAKKMAERLRAVCDSFDITSEQGEDE